MENDSNMDQVKACNNCGNILTQDQKFCPSCGTSVEQKREESVAKKMKLPVPILAGVGAILFIIISCLFIFAFPVKSIEVTQDHVRLEPKKTVSLDYEITPDYALNKKVKWSSSDEKVATVADGVVTAIGAGRCEIMLITNNRKSAVTIVEVTVPVTGITLEELSLTLGIDKTHTLTYDLRPQNASSKSVTWKSSDESVASVVGGKITTHKGGECVITVTTENGKSASCNITVDPVDLEAIYNTLDKPGAGGSIELGYDHSYIEFDTNAFNIDDVFDGNTYYAIEDTIEALGLPASLVVELGQTRALDGRQSRDYDYVSVTWSYHPDNGLNVVITKRSISKTAGDEL